MKFRNFETSIFEAVFLTDYTNVVDRFDRVDRVDRVAVTDGEIRRQVAQGRAADGPNGPNEANLTERFLVPEKAAWKLSSRSPAIQRRFFESETLSDDFKIVNRSRQSRRDDS